MKGSTLTSCTINVIEAAELIYDHLYSDPTIGDLYHMGNLTRFINLVYEAGFGSKLLIDVVNRKPARYSRILQSVIYTMNQERFHKEEAAYIKLYCLDVLNSLSSYPSDLRLELSQLHLSVVA